MVFLVENGKRELEAMLSAYFNAVLKKTIAWSDAKCSPAWMFEGLNVDPDHIGACQNFGEWTPNTLRVEHG